MKTQIRPRITPEEFDVVKKYRGIKKASEDAGVDIEEVKHGWLKTGNASLFFKNPKFKDKAIKELEELKSNLIDFVKTESKHVPKKEYKESGKYLLVIDPADVHIGKLCTMFGTNNEYNSDIAINRVFEGVKGILNYSKRFDIEEIVFIAGNDILHTDTPKRTTTSGTPQDTDGMWYDNFTKACELYTSILTDLSNIAPVRFIYNPSNHDYTNGFFLAQLVEAYFRNNKNITCDVSIKHRKYYQYGKNLIGSTHGDGAKIDNLASLMAQEVPKLWAETEKRYFYTHHLHHKTGKDLIGCTVEALRSPSGTDIWHHINGYTGGVKAIEGYLHHKDFGQVARLTYNF